jgi:hypothetical protein
MCFKSYISDDIDNSKNFQKINAEKEKISPLNDLSNQNEYKNEISPTFKNKDSISSNSTSSSLKEL